MWIFFTDEEIREMAGMVADRILRLKDTFDEETFYQDFYGRTKEELYEKLTYAIDEIERAGGKGLK